MSDFKTYALIEFEDLADDDLKEWLEAKIKEKKLNGGCEFLTKFSSNFEGKKVFLHIGATDDRFLKGAEICGLNKKYKSGELKDFLVEDLENFENSDDLEKLLTQSDRLKIINDELNYLKLGHFVDEVKFNNKIGLYKYDGIINQLIKQKAISSVFPIHDKTELVKLEINWYKSYFLKLFNSIPIDQIRDYFGESVGFYFLFFEFYTKGLFMLTVVCLLLWLLPFASILKFIFLCITNMIWSTMLIEKWKRTSSYKSSEWGAYDLDITENSRVDFEGVARISPITKKLELYYPKSKRRTQKYFVSYPIVFVSIIVTIATMFWYYSIENYCLGHFTDGSYLHMGITYLPSVIYSIVVMVYGILYSFIAVTLTNWENHRTDSSYESNLTAKLFVFYFFNNFVCLFYEAFYNRNYDNLFNMMITLLTANALLNKILEVFAPYLKKKIKKKMYKKKIEEKTSQTIDDLGKQAYILEPEENIYNDYITIFEQFCYITMFSAVFPWLSLLALLNNLMEERSDAFKYCRVSKRPFPKIANGIGPWLFAFEIISFVSVCTNIALISLHPDTRAYFSDYTDNEYILLFVFLEHLMVVLKVSIMMMVPDVPGAILEQKLRNKYESLEVLRQTRLDRIKQKDL